MNVQVSGANILVVGAGKSGRSAAKFLAKRGARVYLADINPRALTEEQQGEMASAGVEWLPGQQDGVDFIRRDFVVLSPGVPPAIEGLQRAREKGVPVLGEVELAGRFLAKPAIAITGTNGKSTSTAMTGAVIAAGGKRVFVGGNLGVPLCDGVDRQDDYDVFVVEVSSFQSETLEQTAFDIAAITNFAPDHLDRYKSLNDYAAAKSRLFSVQKESGWVIFNDQLDWCRKIVAGSPGRPVPFSSRTDEVSEGLSLPSLSTIIFRHGDSVEAYNADNPRLPGLHNRENMMIAVAAARLMGVGVRDVQKAILEFPGLPHRIELVGEINGVRFYNDSKATNVASALIAVNSFREPLLLILGGREKGEKYDDLAAALEKRPVRGVYLIGEAADNMAKALDGRVKYVRPGDLETAFGRILADAREGDVALLSPACASFDQFRNYEHRGESFRALVRERERT
ncbi:MAG: UDP-N-acetylmuramoylalanine--D-glutamate ligase [Myxococcota bacterium]|nr:UDP-N-acetylmuramoylalanine--D-glutamate ligase [Myxococcota bacterium]